MQTHADPHGRGNWLYRTVGKRGDAAYWYAVGIADATGGPDQSEAFRRFHADQAHDYYTERTTHLPSVPDAWLAFRNHYAQEA